METSNEGFSGTAKFFLGLVDVILFNFSIYLSFYIRYRGNIPEYNFQSYLNSVVYVGLFFILINVLFGMYIFYNKSLIDLLSLTLITQVIMTFAIMAVSFFGRWFTFPRSVLFINLLISIVLLFLWRYIAFEIYLKVSGTKKVLLVGEI